MFLPVRIQCCQFHLTHFTIFKSANFFPKYRSKICRSGSTNQMSILWSSLITFLNQYFCLVFYEKNPENIYNKGLIRLNQLANTTKTLSMKLRV